MGIDETAVCVDNDAGEVHLQTVALTDPGALSDEGPPRSRVGNVRLPLSLQTYITCVAHGGDAPRSAISASTSEFQTWTLLKLTPR